MADFAEAASAFFALSTGTRSRANTLDRVIRVCQFLKRTNIRIRDYWGLKTW